MLFSFLSVMGRDKQGAIVKKRKITFKKMSLYDDNHHSFIFGLSGDELLKMMTSMTAQHYFDVHGKYPSRLDRTKIALKHIKD